MLLVNIENKELLSLIVNYLDNTDLNYTTDINASYDTIIIAEVNNKIIKFIEKENNKKIIFLTHLEEENILNNKINDKLTKILNKCYLIITSLPSIKNIISKKINCNIVVIEKELPIICFSKSNSDIYNKYNINKRKKKILVFDFDYDNIEIVNDIAIKYPKYNFVYVGYKSLSKLKNKNIFNKLEKNISLVKYYNFYILSDLTKISYLIINFSDLTIDYLNMILLLKKQLLIKESKLYEDYLINSKNSYIFKDNNDLLIRLNKIIEGRVANLVDNGYLLVRDNTFDEIVKKYNYYLK